MTGTPLATGGTHGGDEREAMVAAGDEGEQRPRPRGRGLREGRPEGDREVAQALGRAEPPPQAEPFRSAMSMLTFSVNRAGKGLQKSRVRKLEIAKDELRKLYGKEKANRR